MEVSEARYPREKGWEAGGTQSLYGSEPLPPRKGVGIVSYAARNQWNSRCPSK